MLMIESDRSINNNMSIIPLIDFLLIVSGSKGQYTRLLGSNEVSIIGYIVHAILPRKCIHNLYPSVIMSCQS